MRPDPITDIAQRWSRIAAAAAALAERSRRDTERAEADASAERTRHERETSGIESALVNARRLAERAQDEAIALAQQSLETDRERLEAKARATSDEIERRAASTGRDAKDAYQQALWLAESVHESTERGPRRAFDELREQVQEREAALQAILDEAARQTRRFRQRVPELPEVSPAPAGMEPRMALAAQVAVAADALERLRRLRVPGLFRGPILIVPAILIAVGAAGVAFGLGVRGSGLGVAAGLGVFVTAIGATGLWFSARKQVLRAWRPLHAAALAGRDAARASVEAAGAQRDATERLAKDQLRKERDLAQAKFEPILESIARQRQDRLRELAQTVADRRRKLDEACAHAQALARTTFDGAIAEAAATHAAAAATERTRHAATVRALAESGGVAREERVAAWKRERDAFQAWADARSADLQSMRSAIEAPAGASNTFPSGLCAGSVTLRLDSLPDALPSEPELAWSGATEWCVPIERPMPEALSTVVEAPAEMRADALGAVQAMAARLLLQCPPGKVRLTLMDPVGLGQGFAGFMHLADEMEQLVGERIWTEPRQIEQKLTDLTEHMETVIQKYLRDEYADIAAYNAQAGQLAEPLRVIVMADFPAGLNDASVRRLGSILQSGARCGVHLLLLRDPARPMPEGLAEADLLRTCRRIVWKAGAFRVDEPGLEREVAELEAPPAGSRLQEGLRAVGQAAKRASVVQVPFSAIEPPAEQVWSGSTAGSLRVPIGRTGATQLQRLELGEGTRQHVLLAGKTGSGKSTLLNAMIVNLATWFSPDELELWLIDFKKGVEFKAYAMHGLPHARAVAVESDREFGLSVLQGLDAELKRRGDLFRSVGVQDLGAWRRLGRAEPMPRALLIVDEFQELFVEEDKVAQESALLLDRLVRQGRAFGMHVILGSQTLGGQYALPRTTMGQMGVRIALQCNEADAAMILGDDNTAARLLSRPGEAIYNDAGGLVEGNSPFQVVWLGDHEREQRVKALAERGRPTAGKRPPMIVFDGTSKADLLNSRALRERAAKPTTAGGLPLHLGEPVAIRDATVAMLRRQSGANMMVVGQMERAAMGLSISVLASVRAAVGVGAQVTILDGSPADSPEAGQLAAAAQALGLQASMPGYRETDDAVRALGDVVAQRLESGRVDEAPIVLLVHGLQRFRSLRRDEDDFSFSAGDGPPKPDRVLAAILRDGPGVGVHAVLWADTATNLQRCIDRGSMREFDLRVLMQMGANDSSALIDSPAASRLGAERALLFSEERGTIERFRPFEPATPADLRALVGA